MGGVHLEIIHNVPCKRAAFLAASILAAGTGVGISSIAVGISSGVVGVSRVVVDVVVVVAIIVTAASASAAARLVDHEVGDHGNNDDNDNEN